MNTTISLLDSVRKLLLEDSKSSRVVVVLSLVWSYLLRNLDCSGSDGNVKTEEKPLSDFSNTELTVSYWVPLEQAHQELSESPRLAFQGPLEAEIPSLRGKCAACGVVVCMSCWSSYKHDMGNQTETLQE